MRRELLIEEAELQIPVVHRDGVGIVRIIRLAPQLQSRVGAQTGDGILTPLEGDAGDLGVETRRVADGRVGIGEIFRALRVEALDEGVGRIGRNRRRERRFERTGERRCERSSRAASARSKAASEGVGGGSALLLRSAALGFVGAFLWVLFLLLFVMLFGFVEVQLDSFVTLCDRLVVQAGVLRVQRIDLYRLAGRVGLLAGIRLLDRDRAGLVALTAVALGRSPPRCAKSWPSAAARGARRRCPRGRRRRGSAAPSIRCASER